MGIGVVGQPIPFVANLDLAITIQRVTFRDSAAPNKEGAAG
jgi:hypothetical protein